MTIRADRIGGSSSEFGQSGMGECSLHVRTFAHRAIEICFANDIPRNTSFKVTIPPDSFGHMAQAMMQADPNAAMKAFGAALQAGLPEAQQRLTAS